MRKGTQIELLRGVWLFERCSRKELAMAASVSTMLDVPAAKVLAREGDLGREFFVIVSGKFEVTRNGVMVGVLGPGDFFGEMALLDRQPRSATVTASKPSEVLVLTAQAFSRAVETMPALDRKMLAVLASRLRELEDRFLPAERYVDTSASPRSLERVPAPATGR